MGKRLDKFMKNMPKPQKEFDPIPFRKIDKLVKSGKLEVLSDGRIFLQEKGSSTLVGRKQGDKIVPISNFKFYVEPLLDEEFISEEQLDEAEQEVTADDGIEAQVEEMAEEEVEVGEDEEDVTEKGIADKDEVAEGDQSAFKTTSVKLGKEE